MSQLTKLGKYEIRRELGKGGMGIVYEGFDPYIQRAVAIKTVLMSSVDKSEAGEVFGRFRREAQAAGRLSHPRIVAIYEYSEDHDMAFIAMELIDGKELKDYFDDGVRFPIRESIDILMQLLDALNYSHRQGVVHRDIKPSNIFITARKQVKVADFGIAKIESSLLTQVGSVLGTPAYMSPEQFQGENVDRRSDLYSAGVILYQLLTGKRPFSGSTITIMHKVLNQQPVLPSAHNAEVPPALDEVVMRAMAKQPEERFQNANEFIAALKLAMRSTPAEDQDATLIVVNVGHEETAGVDDETQLLTRDDLAKPTDIEAWKRIKDSRNADDFLQYLQDYPQGEFAELAKLRYTALDPESIKALKAAELRKLEAERQARREQELAKAQTKAAIETKRQQEIEAQRLQAQQQAASRMNAANAMRRKETASHALRETRLTALKRKMAELKAEADKTRQQEEARRRQAAEQQMQRTQQLAGLMAERSRKLSEIVSKREAEAEAQAKLEAETRQKLAARIRRRSRLKD